jgi:hypothetical protein
MGNLQLCHKLQPENDEEQGPRRRIPSDITPNNEEITRSDLVACFDRGADPSLIMC